MAPRSEVAGNVMDVIQQRTQQRCDLLDGEPTVIRLGLVSTMRVVPFPIGIENGRQPGHFRAAMIEASRIGVGERMSDAQPDIPGAPFVGKADIEQMRADRQLGDDAGPVEVLAVGVGKASVEPSEEVLGIVVAELAERSRSPCYAQRRRRIIKARVKLCQRITPGRRKVDRSDAAFGSDNAPQGFPRRRRTGRHTHLRFRIHDAVENRGWMHGPELPRDSRRRAIGCCS